jgi:hypothetical protein
LNERVEGKIFAATSSDLLKTNLTARSLGGDRKSLFYFVAGFARLASTYPGLLPRFDSTFSQPFSSSTTLSVVPLGTSATTG